jgi:hypothetical protein
MLLARLFARRASPSPSRSFGLARRPGSSRRRTHRTPHVERLEDRTLLSGWVVDAVGTVDDPEGFGVATDSADNVYVVGYFVGTFVAPGVTMTSAGGSDLFVAKYSPAGALIWAQRAGGASSDTGYGIALDSTGNVYVAGNFTGTAGFGGTTLTATGGSADTDILVAKLDGATGNFLWAKSAGGTNSDAARSIATDPSGNAYSTGHFQGTATFGTKSLTSAGGRDIFVWKLDANGNTSWAQRAGSASSALEGGYGIAADSNAVYTTGWFQGTGTFGPTNLTSAGYEDVFVTKLDASGNFVWAIRMGSAADGDRGWAITTDTAGNLLVSGAAYFGSSGSAFVSKLDNLGSTVWTKTFGASGQADVCNSGNPVGRGVAVDSSGNIYTAGYFRGTTDFDPGSGVAYLSSTSPSADNVFVSKLDSSGGFVSARRMGGSGGAAPYGIALDSSESILLTGSFSGTGDFDTGTGTISLTSNASPDLFISKTTQDRGAILGQIFDDLANNAARDFGDTGLASRTVYLDQNDNGVLDAGETSTTTGPAGEYRFTHLVSGTYIARQVVPSGWYQTYPASSAAQTVVLTTSQFVNSEDFGQFNPTLQAGWFWSEGGCKDMQTGLVWSPDTTLVSSWTFWPGLQRAIDLSQNAYSDWRQPTIQEMQTAFAHGAPAIGLQSYTSNAWSMSLTGRKLSNVSTAWMYNFANGTPSEQPVNGSTSLMVVRGGGSVYFVDDGGPGYSDTGGWTIVTGPGQEGDYRYRAKGNGSAQATWSFTGLPPGSYQVQTTWTASSSNAKNAPYTIYNGATLLAQVPVNQQKPPSTTIYGSATIPWQTLGNFTITGNTLNVVLNNKANGNVIADMVRLVSISPTAVAASVATGDTSAASVDAAIASHYNDDNGGTQYADPAIFLDLVRPRDFAAVADAVSVDQAIAIPLYRRRPPRDGSPLEPNLESALLEPPEGRSPRANRGDSRPGKAEHQPECWRRSRRFLKTKLRIQSDPLHGLRIPFPSDDAVCPVRPTSRRLNREADSFVLGERDWLHRLQNAVFVRGFHGDCHELPSGIEVNESIPAVAEKQKLADC